MNYARFNFEIVWLLKRLAERNIIPVSVDDGGERHELVGENRTDYLGHNARLDEATDIMMSVDDSTVWFGKDGKHVATAYFVRGNEPGVILADYSYDPNNNDHLLFEEITKKASEEFVAWTELNNNFFIPEDLERLFGLSDEEIHG